MFFYSNRNKHVGDPTRLNTLGSYTGGHAQDPTLTNTLGSYTDGQAQDPTLQVCAFVDLFESEDHTVVSLPGWS